MHKSVENKETKLLLIEKSQIPRCFAGIESLFVMCNNNKKTSMTSSVFIE